MATIPPSISPSKTTCASLLGELQMIWDEIGESDADRDKMLLQLEQECLDIYRRKVEMSRKFKDDLFQALSEAEAEIANILSALGSNSSFSLGKCTRTLKQQLSEIKPVLDDLRCKKEWRIKEFCQIQMQIVSICAEIAGTGHSENFPYPKVDECDLTTKKLSELKSHLQELQDEKLIRIQKVNSHICSIRHLALLMSVDFLKTVGDIHPNLADPEDGNSKSISNDTLARLTSVIHSLKQEKEQRLLKLQYLGSTLVDLWNLMETPDHEKKPFEHIRILVSSKVDELYGSGCLGQDVIDQAETEFERLNILKASKLKELVFKRQSELEEIYQGVHMDVDSGAARQILTDLIESGTVGLTDLLSSMDNQILKAKQEALSRKDILDKVEKWKFASEEENWLENYEKDENRYSAGRGVHKNLKRAEKARVLVSKLPTIVESLNAKVKAWQMQKGIPFLYEKVPLSNILKEYTKLRQEREEERRRSREQKRLQEQQVVEQEALFGSRSAVKKPLGQSTNTNNVITPLGRRVMTPSRHVIGSGEERRESGKTSAVIPSNFVALPKDDPVSRES